MSFNIRSYLGYDTNNSRVGEGLHLYLSSSKENKYIPIFATNRITKKEQNRIFYSVSSPVVDENTKAKPGEFRDSIFNTSTLERYIHYVKSDNIYIVRNGFMATIDNRGDLKVLFAIVVNKDDYFNNYNSTGNSSGLAALNTVKKVFINIDFFINHSDVSSHFKKYIFPELKREFEHISIIKDVNAICFNPLQYARPYQSIKAMMDDLDDITGMKCLVSKVRPDLPVIVEKIEDSEEIGEEIEEETPDKEPNNVENELDVPEIPITIIPAEPYTAEYIPIAPSVTSTTTSATIPPSALEFSDAEEGIDDEIINTFGMDNVQLIGDNSEDDTNEFQETGEFQDVEIILEEPEDDSISDFLDDLHNDGEDIVPETISETNSTYGFIDDESRILNY